MPLITTTAEIKNYLAIDQNTVVESLLPFIYEAELLYIIPLLGNDFYEELKSDYDPDMANMSEDNQLVMPYIQRSLCYYMAYLAVPQIGVNFGDMGIQQQHGDNSMPAPRWKVEQLQLNYIQQADVHAEKLLEYLEDHATALLYNNWFSSSANTTAEGLMVSNTRIASRYIDINESRRIFLRLKKRIKDIESTVIKRLICKDQYEALVTAIKTNAVDSIQQLLIDMIYPIVSKMALYQTIPALRISITNDGITIYSSNDSVVSKEAADKEQVKSLLYSLRKDDFGYESDITELEEFIEANIADYPLIEASDCYTIKADPGPTWQPTNSVDNKHFSV